jgi:hypothetical protein
LIEELWVWDWLMFGNSKKVQNNCFPSFTVACAEAFEKPNIGFKYA